MILKIDDVSRNDELRKVAAHIDIAIDELIRRRVEDINLTPDIVEGRRLGRVTHHRGVAERGAVVLYRHPVGVEGRQAVPGLRSIQGEFVSWPQTMPHLPLILTSVARPPSGMFDQWLASLATSITAIVWPSVFAT